MLIDKIKPAKQSTDDSPKTLSTETPIRNSSLPVLLSHTGSIRNTEVEYCMNKSSQRVSDVNHLDNTTETSHGNTIFYATKHHKQH